MNGIGIFLLVGMFFLSVVLVGNVFASSVSISTDKPTYTYGDYLTFTIEVSELNGENAILHIRDESAVTSSPINLPITKLKTVITSPKPFDSTVYKTGKYFLEIEYNGNKDETEFTLVESDKIIIPLWIKELGSYWTQKQIDDKTFSQGIQFLIDQGIIKVPTPEENQDVHEVIIPQWVKTSTQWWIEGKITDNEYGMAIQHLIKIGIIKV